MTEQETNTDKINRLRRHLSRMDRADAEMQKFSESYATAPDTLSVLAEMRVDMLTELVGRLSAELREVENNAEREAGELKVRVGRYQHLAGLVVREPHPFQYIISMSDRGQKPSLVRMISDELTDLSRIRDIMYNHGYSEDTHTITIEILTDIPDIC